jgi:hypothetical protein
MTRLCQFRHIPDRVHGIHTFGSDLDGGAEAREAVIIRAAERSMKIELPTPEDLDQALSSIVEISFDCIPDERQRTFQSRHQL